MNSLKILHELQSLHNYLCWRWGMHWNNFSGSRGVSPARVEEDDEHRHDDEEAKRPQEVVQEDVHLCAPAVIWSLPGGKM